MMIRSMLLAAACATVCAAACASLCGCSILRDPCSATAAARASSAVLVADAQTRLDEAEGVLVYTFHDRVPREALGALRDARTALDAARATLASVDDVCAASDVSPAFAAFRAAWLMLEPFLSLLAKSDGTPMGLLVERPLLVSP
jgi:hypothetical protein